ncbi:MAG: SIMPL domain-containing protein [Actinomycetota bacterium]|nr:SIMPL domain-containing protein [Actinomycetota bacterium]
MKLAHIAVIAAAGVAIAAFAGVFQPSGARSAPAADTAAGGITVLGTGSANLIPDRASFAFGTVSQAVTANAALAATSQAVTRVIAALKKAGVAQGDIQTSDVSLSPRMNDKGDVIVGYTASNTVTATLRKIGDAGDVVDAAVGAGANQVSGPNLLASDQDAAYRNALKGAVADARTKAETLAAASSSTLGKITAIVEGGGGVPPMPFAVGAAKDSSVPIEPGTQKIEATVSVTFAFG